MGICVGRVQRQTPTIKTHPTDRARTAWSLRGVNSAGVDYRYLRGSSKNEPTAYTKTFTFPNVSINSSVWSYSLWSPEICMCCQLVADWQWVFYTFRDRIFQGTIEKVCARAGRGARRPRALAIPKSVPSLLLHPSVSILQSIMLL